MKILPLLGVLLVIVIFLFITMNEDSLREKYSKEGIRKATAVSCTFGTIGVIPSSYYITEMFFGGADDFNGHLSLVSSQASKEIYCPSSLILGDDVEAAKLRCNSEDGNCHVSETDSGGIVLGFDSGVNSCSFKSSCSDDEVCLFKVNSLSNSHIASCAYSDTGYDWDVCCSLEECVDDSDCPSGYECDSGNCVEEDSSCGNGIIDSDEFCDCGSGWVCSIAELDNRTCASFVSYSGGTLGCNVVNSTNECSFNYTRCIVDDDSPTCGDGIIDYNDGEYCDTASTNLFRCTSSPSYTSSLASATVSCVNDAGDCECRWASSDGWYSYDDCYCPDNSCTDLKGVRKKYWNIEDALTGDVNQTLVGEFSCDLESVDNADGTIWFTTSDYAIVMGIMIILIGLFFGVNYYMKKKGLINIKENDFV